MCKTIMRLMMIGLVAMLGAKAEAHYVVVKGKVKYCSVCVEAELKEDKGNPVDPKTHDEKVEFRLMTKKIEILCPKETVVQSTKNVTLVVRKLIVQEVEGVVFDEASLVNSNFCPDSSPPDVLVRAMKVEIKTYACDLLDPPTCKQVRKSVKLDCKLPKKFDFNNKPPPGILYVCS